ncbi:hypothetical protein GIB67_026581 [Kingdonia uniflora]|uniref:AB hydrolase-1 domain-containing protein n=1 Tax=Kingdonia uniflora TaxID=39325 RepID=A0A7J7NND0_9MAGN|nr:hypothetical protein GIB67_026581 [Kingdonia uniflora]
MAPTCEDCTKRGEIGMMTKVPLIPHFVLVHGIGGGAWCWYKIRCLMESSGYKVSCVDLKSAGVDASDPNSVLTFEEYNKPLFDLLSSLPDNEKVILVGHSAGGLSVTHALHKFGKKIHLGIYVAATMLRLGFMTEQDVKDGAPDLSIFGDNLYDFGFGEGYDQLPTSIMVKKEFHREIIYQMCSLEDTILASMLLKPGPIRALQGAQFTEGQGVDELRRIYIRTKNDNVVKPEQQDAMIKRWPPSEVFVLESDHSPFFSSPFLLFGMLVKAIASMP